LINRKQFIEYKLKLATRASNEGGSGSLLPAEKASLIQELTEVKGNLDRLSRQFEKDFGESGPNVASGLTQLSPTPYSAVKTAPATEAVDPAIHPAPVPSSSAISTPAATPSSVQSRIHAFTKPQPVPRR
jgi:hypothetical protein